VSWHFLQEQEAASWADSSLDGAPSALSRLLPTAEMSCLPGSERDSWADSQSGMTSGRSMADPGEDTLTSSAEASPARTSAQRELDLGLTESALDSGENSPASSEKSGRRTSSSKILPSFALAGLSPSSRILPTWGMMRAGVCLALEKPEPRITGKGCGLLPTPTGAGNELSPSMQKWPGHRRLLAMLQNLPTPRASDADRGGRGDLLQVWRGNMLSTPTASLYGSNRGGAAGRKGKVRPSLEALTGGPWISFREWMMGWPIGWSGLGPLATDRFQQWLQWHGGCCDE
jgi:hypothetical protein